MVTGCGNIRGPNSRCGLINHLTKGNTLLCVPTYLEDSAQIYGWQRCTQECFYSLITQYGTSVSQVQKHLLGVKENLQAYVLNLAMEMGRLAGWAHPSMPTEDWDHLAMDYLTTLVHCQYLCGGCTAQAIEDYLAVGSFNYPAIRTIGVQPAGATDWRADSTTRSAIQGLVKVETLDQAFKWSSVVCCGK